MRRALTFTLGLLIGMAPILANPWPKPDAIGVTKTEFVPVLVQSTAFDAQRYCAAVAVFGEASGESVEGKQAVARVIHNRAVTGRWGYTPCEVVSARRQFAGFTAWRNRPPPWMVYPDAWTESWDAVLQARNGEFPACVADATHFDSVRFRTPYWARSMIHLCTVGKHRFYKEKT